MNYLELYGCIFDVQILLDIFTGLFDYKYEDVFF
jgi:hypothetical protein